jgi:hypothetical protein
VATADINLADGTKIRIDGTPEEIARVLVLYQKSHPPVPAADPGRAESSSLVGSAQRRRSEPKPRVGNGAMQYIRGLITDNYFSERRSLADVMAKLEEMARIYPPEQVSTPLRRLVLSKELRRLRDGKNWAYVNN